MNETNECEDIDSEVSDKKKPFWKFVKILSKSEFGRGGNCLWNGTLCDMEKTESYKRVKALILHIKKTKESINDLNFKAKDAGVHEA